VTPAFPFASETDASARPNNKKKRKTRPSELIQEPELVEAQPEPLPASPERPPVFVSKANLDVFARFWPDDSGSIKEGTIRWPNILLAMTDAGCSIWHKDGPKVNFQLRLEGGQKQTMQFHKPHKDGDTADASVLTRMGFRLHRRFGWKWKHFQEKPRDGVAEQV